MASGVPISSPAASAVEQPFASAGLLWSGRILTALVALFLLFERRQSDEGFFRARRKRSARPFGKPCRDRRSPPLSTILDVIPRTSILGAMLLSAVSAAPSGIQRRGENPRFSQTLFPVYFGVPVCPGLYFPQSLLARAGCFAKLI